MVSYVFAMAMALVTATFFVSCGGTKHVLTTTANEGIIYCGAMIDSSKGYAVGDDGAIRLTTDGAKIGLLQHIKAVRCFRSVSHQIQSATPVVIIRSLYGQPMGALPGRLRQNFP